VLSCGLVHQQETFPMRFLALLAFALFFSACDPAVPVDSGTDMGPRADATDADGADAAALPDAGMDAAR